MRNSFHRLFFRTTQTVLVVVLCVAQGIHAGERPDRSHGLLWEVSKPGQAASHLFGTIHLENPEVLKLPAPVQGAFDGAHHVVLEMLIDMEAMIYSSTAMLMTDGRLLSDIVGRSLFTRIAAAVRSRGVPDLVLERMKPWAAAVTLSMPAAGTGAVLDMALYQQAQQAGKRLYGLETIQEQLDVFDKLSQADQVALLEEALEQSADIDAIHAELLAAYLRRDLAAMLEINEEQLQASGDQRLARDFQRRLLDDRNLRMVERMQQYLMQGNAFVAVGALHLPGETGLLNLLEQRGYKVRAVY